MLSASPCGSRTPLSPLTQSTLEKNLPGLTPKRFLKQNKPTTAEVGCITDLCSSEDLPEVEIFSLLEEQIPKYKLRADTLTQFTGYQNEDWFVPSPVLKIPDGGLRLNSDQIRETLNYFHSVCERENWKMSATPTSSSQQSSGNEKTPDSGIPRTRRAYTKSCNSPTLRAFKSFDESLGQFFSYVKTKMKRVGTDDVYELAAQLQRLNKEYESMQKDLKSFISKLDDTITNYEKEKPTDLAVDANSVISTEEQTANRSSLFKGTKTIDEISADLSTSLGYIYAAIHKKIHESMYNDQYSMSLERKLKKLKKMCEATSKQLEEIGNEIKGAINENGGLIFEQMQQQQALQQRQQR